MSVLFVPHPPRNNRVTKRCCDCFVLASWSPPVARRPLADHLWLTWLAPGLVALAINLLNKTVSLRCLGARTGYLLFPFAVLCTGCSSIIITVLQCEAYNRNIVTFIITIKPNTREHAECSLQFVKQYYTYKKFIYVCISFFDDTDLWPLFFMKFKIILDNTRKHSWCTVLYLTGKICVVPSTFWFQSGCLVLFTPRACSPLEPYQSNCGPPLLTVVTSGVQDLVQSCNGGAMMSGGRSTSSHCGGGGGWMGGGPGPHPVYNIGYDIGYDICYSIWYIGCWPWVLLETGDLFYQTFTGTKAASPHSLRLVYGSHQDSSALFSGQ